MASKITRSARGENCEIRIPGICNYNPETTVLCHDSSFGMGIKSPDYLAAYGCSSCHDEVDGRTLIIANRLQVKLWFNEAIKRTIKILFEKGLLVEK